MEVLGEQVESRLQMYSSFPIKDDNERKIDELMVVIVSLREDNDKLLIENIHLIDSIKEYKQSKINSIFN